MSTTLVCTNKSAAINVVLFLILPPINVFNSIAEMAAKKILNEVDEYNISYQYSGFVRTLLNGTRVTETGAMMTITRAKRP